MGLQIVVGEVVAIPQPWVAARATSAAALTSTEVLSGTPRVLINTTTETELLDFEFATNAPANMRLRIFDGPTPLGIVRTDGSNNGDVITPENILMHRSAFLETLEYDLDLGRFKFRAPRPLLFPAGLQIVAVNLVAETTPFAFTARWRFR